MSSPRKLSLSDSNIPDDRIDPADCPSRKEAEAAVRVLLRWAGDDPQREGLLDTPARVAHAYEEFFRGYE